MDHNSVVETNGNCVKCQDPWQSRNHVLHNLLYISLYTVYPWSHQRIVKSCPVGQYRSEFEPKPCFGLFRQHVWIDICANISKYVTLLQHITTCCWNSSLCLLKSKHLSVIFLLSFHFTARNPQLPCEKIPNCSR